MTKTLENQKDISQRRIRKSQINQYELIVNRDNKEEFEEIRTLYIINNVFPPKEKRSTKLSKPLSSIESETNEDVEKLLQDLLNKNVEEHKFFQNNTFTSNNDYENLSSLRMKRLRESIESPVFGSKVDSYQSQKNLGRGMTLTSKDELDHAQTSKQVSQMFKKKMRNFSFHDSENSSFPSSYTNSILRQDTLNSKGTNTSNKTSNFNVVKKNKRKSNSSRKSGKKYGNPKNFKNHLKTIAQLVGADKNVLPLPQENDEKVIIF